MCVSVCVCVCVCRESRCSVLEIKDKYHIELCVVLYTVKSCICEVDESSLFF